MTPTTQPADLSEYRPDAQGRLVHNSQIRVMDRERDLLINDLVEKALMLRTALADFRQRAHDDIQAFAELSAERYGAKLGGRKGNITLTSFSGQYKVVRAISDQLAFDERIQAAKALIDECLTEWVEGTRSEVRTLIGDAFKVDKQGKVDTARVLSLRRLEIADERWQRAMKAIGESLQIASCRNYVRFYERVGNTERYEPINLDLANA